MLTRHDYAVENTSGITNDSLLSSSCREIVSGDIFMKCQSLKPSFHMVVNVSRLCRKCRRDRL